MSELNDTLVFKMFHDPQIEVSYFEGGYIRKISGYIHKVDTNEQYLHLYEETGLFKIRLSEITEIKCLTQINGWVPRLNVNKSIKLYSFFRHRFVFHFLLVKLKRYLLLAFYFR